MATLYWIGSGGPGYWSDGNNWSLTSGGSPAGVVPTSSDSVVFDSNSSNNCTIDVTFTVVNFTFSGLCQNVVFQTAYPTITYFAYITGNLDLSGGYFYTSQSFSTLSKVEVTMTPAAGATTYATMSADGVYDLRIHGASSSSVVELSGQSGAITAKVRTLYLIQGQCRLSSTWAGLNRSFTFGDTTPYATSFGGINGGSNLTRSLYCSVDVQINCFGDISFGSFTNFGFGLTDRSKITFMGAAATCGIGFPNISPSTINLPIIENRLGYSPDTGMIVGPTGARDVIFGSSTTLVVDAYVKCEPQSGAGSSYVRGMLFLAGGTVRFTGASLSYGETPLDVSGTSSTEKVRIGSYGATQTTLAFTGSASFLTTSLDYTNVSYINSQSPYKIIALFANGNTDNGNNTNVIFENTGSGFFTLLI